MAARQTQTFHGRRRQQLKNKTLKKISAAFLALLMVGTCCSGCSKNLVNELTAVPTVEHIQKAYEKTDGAVRKDETVFINLSPDGSVSKVNVTDHIQTQMPQVRVEDVSNLADIRDAKTFLEPVFENDRIYWDMDSTDLYYSGTSQDTPPVSFEVSYTLDGKETSYKSLAGKSGRLEITIKAENLLRSNDGYGVCCPMVMLGGMILPEETFRNIEISNGAVIGDGAQQMVFFVGVPGMDESLGLSQMSIPGLSASLLSSEYKITADVSDFEIGNMMFAAMPFSSVDQLCTIDLGEGIDGVKMVLSDVETLIGAFSSLGLGDIVKMLYGDMQQTEELLSAVADAALLYDENKQLIEAIAPFATQENIDKLNKVIDDLDKIDMEQLQGVLDCTLLNELLSLLSRLDCSIGYIATLTKDSKELIPIMNDLNEQLQNEEVRNSIDNLPQTVERLHKLMDVLEQSRPLIESLEKLNDSEYAAQVNTVMGIASKYTSLDCIGQAQSAHLAARTRAWLDFGEQYSIFTQKTDAMQSSVVFVYKVDSIG